MNNKNLDALRAEYGPSTLLIADHPGHILERICRSWMTHGHGARHTLATTVGVDNYSIAKLTRGVDVTFWVDNLRFSSCGGAILGPQVLFIHHVTAGTEGHTYMAASRADALIAPCRQWQQAIQRATGRLVHLIPYSIDTDVFQPSPSRDAIRTAQGLLSSDVVLGFVGKASADHLGRKGVSLFCDVVDAAARRWSNIAVALIGPGWNDLAKRLRTRGIKTVRLEFPSCDLTQPGYAILDALLVTAREEGGPCTVLEAMASGVPVISSAVGMVPELVIDGETGFICPRREVSEYLGALEVLQSDPNRTAAIKANARRFIDAEYRDQVVIRRIDFSSICLEALGEYRSRSWPERSERMLRSAYAFGRHAARGIAAASNSLTRGHLATRESA